MPAVEVHKRTIIPQLLGVGSEKHAEGRMTLTLISTLQESYEFELGPVEKAAIVRELVGIEVASSVPDNLDEAGKKEE